ncbi:MULTISPECIES: hypothetical protein [unclassified Photobacterium]|uniref:hypothetical protein n=1 Tax=unclassified Photobacterium TaxID=2628852 RepID=UPI000D1592A3|nr:MULTISPECIES: hypothetical protein [unclassified Photobacterium]PSV39246.1 hypothetical protein C9J44_00240 [Photobacterium sp. GB-27]PSV40548.1 hypothetical protein C9J38_00505 [Photobacterium sp. GB-210]PSV55455.1 hypothetical protein C9J45_02565 [Photobacterium sp. GB-1]PSW75568.1 hypothetical protein C9J41_02630 [Photobacterium sp. GB-50]
MGEGIPRVLRLCIASQILAVLVALSIFRQFDRFDQFFTTSQIVIVPNIIVLLVLFSGVLAIIGLLKGQKWGFLPLYFYIPAATMFLNISIIPILPELVPSIYRNQVILGLNSVVLVYSVFLLLRRMDRNLLHEV